MFEEKDVNIPQNDEHSNSSKIDSTTKESLNTAEDWGKIIRKNGVAYMHGKLHPDWFNKDVTESIITPIKEPSFSDKGHINAKPVQFGIGSPLGIITTKIFEHAENPFSVKKIYKKDDQLLFLGPPRTSTDEYNTRMLESKFDGNWRELQWGAHVKEHKDVLSRTTRSIPLILKIFLPDELASELFDNLKNNPHLSEKLMNHLYPGMPQEPIGKRRMYSKKLTENELKMKKDRAIHDGGTITPFP